MSPPADSARRWLNPGFVRRQLELFGLVPEISKTRSVRARLPVPAAIARITTHNFSLQKFLRDLGRFHCSFHDQALANANTQSMLQRTIAQHCRSLEKTNRALVRKTELLRSTQPFCNAQFLISEAVDPESDLLVDSRLPLDKRWRGPQCIDLGIFPAPLYRRILARPVHYALLQNGRCSPKLGALRSLLGLARSL